MPHNKPGTTVFLYQRSWQNLNEVTQWGHQMQVGWVKFGTVGQRTKII